MDVPSRGEVSQLQKDLRQVNTRVSALEVGTLQRVTPPALIQRVEALEKLARLGSNAQAVEPPTYVQGPRVPSKSFPHTTPTGHVYAEPKSVEPVRAMHAVVLQGDVENWDYAELPPNPTWDMVGLLLRRLSPPTTAAAKVDGPVYPAPKPTLEIAAAAKAVWPPTDASQPFVRYAEGGPLSSTAERRIAKRAEDVMHERMRANRAEAKLAASTDALEAIEQALQDRVNTLTSPPLGSGHADPVLAAEASTALLTVQRARTAIPKDQ